MAVAIAISLAAFGALAVVTSSDLALPLPPLLIARQAVYVAASIDGWISLAACSVEAAAASTSSRLGFAVATASLYRAYGCYPIAISLAACGALAGAPPLTWLCRRRRCWLHVWQSTAASTDGWLGLAVARSV